MWNEWAKLIEINLVALASKYEESSRHNSSKMRTRDERCYVIEHRGVGSQSLVASRMVVATLKPLFA
ncbi:hypothetical protein IEQ34_016710 [Dendrobium chrysotoxum]|uniref:Uncharacterized protein n=1 Tax=Dendrobium chrysotoxum TaxID=161865 RepID=A0AAV7GE71_DENCH|nr:hypothetical protein IEQ34_016710 [Dendrobium chrysotoxum]